VTDAWSDIPFILAKLQRCPKKIIAIELTLPDNADALKIAITWLK
jgi:hypothetical protein